MYSLLALVADVVPGHGFVHLLVQSARVIWFSWDPQEPGWVRPGLPLRSQLAGLDQHFKSSILDDWKHMVCFNLCRRQGFRGGWGRCGVWEVVRCLTLLALL